MDEAKRQKIREDQERVQRMPPETLFDYCAEWITAYMLRHPSQQEGEIIEALAYLADEIGKWRHHDPAALPADELRRLCLVAWGIEE